MTNIQFYYNSYNSIKINKAASNETALLLFIDQLLYGTYRVTIWKTSFLALLNSSAKIVSIALPLS